MSLPLFYIDHHLPEQDIVNLQEETGKHVIQVLRMKAGEKLQLTDGNGNLFTTEIINDHKKFPQVKILSSLVRQQSTAKLSIAISLIKNNSRFEWFLEKATEIGVNEIIPLICERTERQHFRFDRMKTILVSAMLQSRQVWLPKLSEPVRFNDCIKQIHHPQKFIAHCLPDKRQSFANSVSKDSDTTILIGPEGDFTQSEIDFALQNNCVPVSLGETRLRTETAGIVAVTLARNTNL